MVAIGGRSGRAEGGTRLEREVGLLTRLLDEVVGEQEGAHRLALVERLRGLAAGLRGRESRPRRAVLEAELTDLDPDAVEVVTRFLALRFQLLNLAEEIDRIRALRRRERAAGSAGLDDSFAAAVRRLRAAGRSEDDVDRLLARLEVTPVLTAHPTEARRRTVLVGLRRAYALLDGLDDPGLLPRERADLERRLCEEITNLWLTAEVRQERPTPLDEVRTAMVFFDATIFRATPRLYRALDAALDASPDDPGRARGRRRGAGGKVDRDGTGNRPPRVPAFLRWGSWIGGDRDGNPAVTAEITAATMRIQADHLLHGYEAVASRLMTQVSVRPRADRPLPAVARRLERDEDELPEPMREMRARFPREPYRRRLGAIAERLRRTRAALAGLPGPQSGRYPDPAALVAELDELRDSLVEDGARRIAYGEIQDFRWQVQTFGFHFASLEVRQHASVHRAALDALQATPPEPGRMLVPGVTAAEVLATFRTMAAVQRRFGVDACRRAVVSFTSGVDDVLGVLRLASLAGDASLPAVVAHGLAPAVPAVDVVPLFESAAALAEADGIVAALLADPAYRAHLASRGGRQEIMLGYSDSNKENGFVAAAWMLQRAMEHLVAVSATTGVPLLLFHGRGGAIGRGGGPTHRAILAQPPGSVAGRVKLTEQGEVIATRYANPLVALRGLEQVASATLLASIPEHAELSGSLAAAGAEVMDELAEAARAAYRALAWDDPDFPAVFARITPIDAISDLRIGSRPAARGELAAASNGSGSSHPLEALRAIPWVFAWSQARVNLPGWFGLGSALELYLQRHGGAGRRLLTELHGGWPFFRGLLQLAELSLARTDADVGRRRAAIAGPAGQRVWDRIQAEHDRSVALLLAVLGRERLLGGLPAARRLIDRRMADLALLADVQAGLIERLGELDEGTDEAAEARRLVQLTISAIAAGVQATG